MNIGQIAVGFAFVGGAVYLNRSGMHRQPSGYVDATFWLEVQRAARYANMGRCDEANSALSRAYGARDTIADAGQLAHEHMEAIRVADRAIVRNCNSVLWDGDRPYQNPNVSGLGDDPLVPPAGGDYDPRKAGRNAFLRTHLAKKFWGSTVLAAQSSVSLNKLSKRIRKYSAPAADDAARAADEAWKLHASTLALARKYNAEWVKAHAEQRGQQLLPYSDQPGK